MKKPKFLLGLLFSAFLLAGTTSAFLLHKNKPVEAKAEKPINEIVSMVGAWNGSDYGDGLRYWYLVAFENEFDAAADATNVKDTVGQHVTLNGTRFSDIDDSKLQINYTHGHQYFCFVIPTNLMVEQPGKGGCFIHVEEGTEFHNYSVHEFTLTINVETKVAALNAQVVTVEKFEPNYWGWFTIDLNNYPVVAQTTTSIYAANYKSTGLDFVSKIYVNGDEGNYLLNQEAATVTVTANINGKAAFSFQESTALRIADSATINYLGIKAGTVLPVLKDDGSAIALNKCAIVIEDSTCDKTGPIAFTDSNNYGIVSLNDVNTSLEETKTYDAAGNNYILNNISPLTGDSVKLKFRMNIASGTDIDYKFNACGNLANPHYKIQIGSAGGTPYSQVIYGENAGGAGEVKLYKSASALLWDYDNLIELYSVTDGAGNIHLGLVINGIVVVDYSDTYIAADVGAVICFGGYQTAAGLTFKCLDVDSEALLTFKTKGLLMDTIPTSDTSSTGACIGARYNKAKSYYLNSLTAAQKTAFSAHQAACDRLAAWAEANGETFNPLAGTLSSHKGFTSIIFEGSDNKNLIIILTVSITSILAISAFFMVRRRHQ